MNDFTKEELKEILWHLVTPKSIEPGNTIAARLQDMIENYCEHGDAYECNSYAKFCPACDKHIGEKVQGVL
jgi:hypothetical protein